MPVCNAVRRRLCTRHTHLSTSLIWWNTKQIFKKLRQSHPTGGKAYQNHGAQIRSGGYILVCSQGLTSRRRQSAGMHNRSRQWQKLNWLRLVEPRYLRNFETTLQYFCNHTLVYLQHPFCISATRFICTQQDSFGAKNVTAQAQGPKWPPLFQKTKRHRRWAPTDLLWCKDDMLQTWGPN